METIVIVQVFGGSVQEIDTNDKTIKVLIADWDNAACDPYETFRCKKIASIGKNLFQCYHEA